MTPQECLQRLEEAINAVPLSAAHRNWLSSAAYQLVVSMNNQGEAPPTEEKDSDDSGD